MDGCAAVIHLTGIIRELGAATFENIHVLGTRNVAATARNAGIKRFLHISALGTRPNAASRYHQTKWAAEEIIRASGLDHSIFRPSVIYGRNDEFVNLFARISRFSPVVPVFGGRTKLQPVPVADVGRCFANALTEPEAIGRTFDLCGKDVLSVGEIIDAILQATGRRRLKMSVPMFAARLQALAFEAIFPGVFGKAPPLTRDQLLMLGEDNVGDAGPANKLFKLNPVSFREGIAEFLNG
jgi:NADH dehydrogenase